MKGAEEEKTIAKGIDFCSFGRCSAAEEGDCQTGKATAILDKIAEGCYRMATVTLGQQQVLKTLRWR